MEPRVAEPPPVPRNFKLKPNPFAAFSTPRGSNLRFFTTRRIAWIDYFGEPHRNIFSVETPSKDGRFKKMCSDCRSKKCSQHRKEK